MTTAMLPKSTLPTRASHNTESHVTCGIRFS